MLFRFRRARAAGDMPELKAIVTIEYDLNKDFERAIKQGGEAGFYEVPILKVSLRSMFLHAAPPLNMEVTLSDSN